MVKVTRNMLIYCGGRPYRYTLAKNGEDWKAIFMSFEEAVDHARSIVIEKLPLLIYSTAGKLLLTTSVSPALPPS
jgi:hypothetical protein